MKTCSFGPCRDCDGVLREVGPARIEQLGGFLPAKRYAGRTDCPRSVVATLPTGEPFQPEVTA